MVTYWWGGATDDTEAEEAGPALIAGFRKGKMEPGRIIDTPSRRDGPW